MDGIGLDQSQVADAINRKYQGMSQRERNQKMAQAQSGGASSFQQSFGPEISQAQQPTEFWGAGRKLAENQGLQDEGFNILNTAAPVLGGQRYFYGDKDPTSSTGLSELYDKTGYSQYKAQKDLEASKATRLQDYAYLYNMYDVNKLPEGKLLGQMGGPAAARATIQANLDKAKQYVLSGFIPGQNVGDYVWHQNAGPSAKTYGANSGYWGKVGTNDPGLMWDATRGYTGVQPMDQSAAMRDSIKTVGSVIGSVVLPGLGTSWTGLAGDTLNAAGIPTPSFSTTSLGLPANAAKFADRSLTSGALGGLSSLFQGGDFLTGALRGGLSSLASDGIGKSLGDVLKSTGLTSSVSNPLVEFAKGSSSGLINNLFGKNTGQSNLESAITGGLGRTLGSVFAPTNGSMEAKNTSYKNARDLVNLFNKARKLK